MPHQKRKEKERKKERKKEDQHYFTLTNPSLISGDDIFQKNVRRSSQVENC
jgi:type IV secretory pathway VirD2 relaxase